MFVVAASIYYGSHTDCHPTSLCSGSAHSMHASDAGCLFRLGIDGTSNLLNIASIHTGSLPERGMHGRSCLGGSGPKGPPSK